MRTIWRFFVDETGRWRWEELHTDKTVIRGSEGSFAHYDECLKAAKQAGYEFEASQQASPRSMSTRKRD
ncbi:MAG TPA: hypothetical protein VIQ62_04670 [Burkholderiales bacterium]|jgi:hypothetical protein